MLRTITWCKWRYTEQDGMVDQVFPPIGKDGFDPDFRIQVSKSFWQYLFDMSVIRLSVNHVSLTQEFSTFGFWKDGLPEIDLDDLAEIIPQSQEDVPRTWKNCQSHFHVVRSFGKQNQQCKIQSYGQILLSNLGTSQSSTFIHHQLFVTKCGNWCSIETSW